MWHGNGRARRALRRFTLGSGPLKRRSDRLEFGGRVILTLVLLLAVLAAVLVGLTSAAKMRAMAAAQAVDRHTVTGTLIADAPQPADAERDAAVQAPVTYPVASGTREGVALVPTGSREGTPVELWVTRAGDITTPPMDTGKVTAQAIGMGLGVFCGIGTLAVLGYLGFRWVLGRGRMRRWATGWAAVEPRWSGKVR